MMETPTQTHFNSALVSAGQGAIHPAFSRGMTENDGSSRPRRPSGAPRHSRLNGGKARRPILYRLSGVQQEVFPEAGTDQLHALGQAVVAADGHRALWERPPRPRPFQLQSRCLEILY